MSSQKRHHVVIIGAGFAGLNACKRLAHQKLIDVTILDRRNYHLFQPLLYQVATAGLSPADIAIPIRQVFSKAANVEVLMTNVTGLDLDKHLVQHDGGTLSYDSLIIACGATHSYFGHPEWEARAPGLKTLEQATDIRRRILLAYERAERLTDPAAQAPYLTFVVVGGGPTGVEMAGAISEISRCTLEKDFRHIDPTHSRIVLIEAGPRILPAFEPSLSQRATLDLRKLGVEVRTDTRVMNVTADGVDLAKGKVQAQTVIWAAGVEPAHLSLAMGVELDRQGRVMVDATLALPGHPEVFVLGDQAHTKGADGRPMPGLAPVAIQQGRWTARNILRRVQKNQPARPFHYLDKGMMATIGRKKAVAQSGRLRVHGLLAWLMWLFIHIYYLIGFRNRVSVFLQWMWSYLTFKRGARLIVGEPAD